MVFDVDDFRDLLPHCHFEARWVDDSREIKPERITNRRAAIGCALRSRTKCEPSTQCVTPARARELFALVFSALPK